MSGVNRALARIKKSSRKRYDPENGGKSIKTDLSNLNTPKRKHDSDHVNGRKEMKQDFGRIIPLPMTPDRYRQKRRKICERGEQGGRDSEDIDKSCQKKIPLLQKGKESFSCENVMPTIDGLISPTKALRVAQLKKRFGDLIFKATHQPVMSQGDPRKLQQERERLQKEQIAEKAKIEEQIKVSETILRIRAEDESKMQRQREREAARIALERMERTVEFNDALQTIREFESLLGCIC